MRDYCEGHGRDEVVEKNKKSAKSGGHWWLSWMFPAVGLASIVWFLLRVVPKPSRVAYPCQRVAIPLASGFFVWLVGTFGSILAYRHGKALYLRSRLGTALVFAVIAVAAGVIAIARMPEAPAVAEDGLPTNVPIGVAQGIFPGRVVWVHDPNATDWDGYESEEHWWESQCTDQEVVTTMLSNAIRVLAGEPTNAQAWDAIFRHYNLKSGKGDVGYRPGETIAIKINLTTCNARSVLVDPVTYNKQASTMNRIDNSPQILLALLRQLVNDAGVSQADISIGDPTGMVPNFMWNILHPQFPSVLYVDNYGGSGRTRSVLSDVPFYWSTDAANHTTQDYVPSKYANAEYIINIPVLKGHSAGITICGKNHYGSLLRCPDGYLRGAGNSGGEGMNGYYSMHYSLPNAYMDPPWSPGMGQYRAIVDLMGHDELGGKTVLYLVDGLFAGYYWDAVPYKWHTPPFNNDWPSTIFASLDPVAIDSVGYDFLLAEWPVVVTGGNGGQWSLEGGAEDYLHEAAQADGPGSGTFYDPERDGVRMASLGVHEHWDNPTDKQYSRNLGTDSGIELLKITDKTLLDNTLADFAITSIVIEDQGLSLPENSVFTAHVSVRNMGVTVGNAGKLNIWVDQSSTVECGDDQFDTWLDVGTLDGGQSQEFTFTGLSTGSVGAKTLRAFIDADCEAVEPYETNNQGTETYSVQQALPDFVVTDVTLDLPDGDLEENGTFDAQVTVANQGTVAGDAGYLDVWTGKESSAQCGEDGDVSQSLGVLAVGETTTIELTDLTAGTAGTSTLRVFANSQCVSSELDQDNNQSTASYQVVLAEIEADILYLNRCVLKKGAKDSDKGKLTIKGESVNVSLADFQAADEIAISIRNESDETLIFGHASPASAYTYTPGSNNRDGKYTLKGDVKVKFDLDKDTFTLSAKNVNLDEWTNRSVVVEIEIGENYVGVGDD